MKKLPSIPKEKLKKYIKIVVVLGVILLIGLLVFLVLRILGWAHVIDFNEILNIFRDFIKKTGPWAVIVYIALRVVATVFLSFMPACSMAFDLLCIATFDYLTPLGRFGICFASVVITSIVMDFIGRFGGNKAIVKILGQEDYDEAKDLVKEKGMVYVPVMYLLPIFPDDAICMVSGATKMNFWVHLIEIVLCRGIGCATIIFGVEIIPSSVSSFTSTNILDYLRVGIVLGAYLLLLLYLARVIDKFLTKKLVHKK